MGSLYSQVQAEAVPAAQWHQWLSHQLFDEANQ